MVTITEEDLAGFTRRLTDADVEALRQAEVELEKRGFDIQSKKNAITLLRSFDQAKHIPMTVENLIKTVETFKDSFDWLSPDEVEYKKLSAQLGSHNSDLLWNYMAGHRLEATYSNFNSCARFYLANHWGLESRDQFSRLLGNLQNSRQGQYGEALTWKPTPDEARRAKELEKVVSTPTTRTPEEIAAEREAAVSHISSGLSASDPYGHGRYKPYKPVNATNQPPKPIVPEQDPTEAYFGERTTKYIESIPSGNDQSLAQEHVQNLRAQGMGWTRIFVNLENWYNKLKTNRWQSQQRG